MVYIPDYYIPFIACLLLIFLAIGLVIISTFNKDKQQKTIQMVLILIIMTSATVEFGIGVIAFVSEWGRITSFVFSVAVIIGGFVVPSIYFINRWKGEENEK